MNIVKATIVLTFAADLVILHTDDKPSSMPNVTSQLLDVTFYAAYNTGENYVKTNFPGIEIIVHPRN